MQYSIDLYTNQLEDHFVVQPSEKPRLLADDEPEPSWGDLLKSLGSKCLKHALELKRLHVAGAVAVFGLVALVTPASGGHEQAHQSTAQSLLPVLQAEEIVGLDLELSAEEAVGSTQAAANETAEQQSARYSAVPLPPIPEEAVNVTEELLRKNPVIAPLLVRAHDMICPVSPPYNIKDDARWGVPRGGGTRSHQGDDIFGNKGAPVLAITDGRVEFMNSDLGGLGLLLTTTDGFQFYYAHNDSNNLEYEGQFVEKGTVLGTVGNSGNARTTPPHVHFTVKRVGASPVDPTALSDIVCPESKRQNVFTN